MFDFRIYTNHYCDILETFFDMQIQILSHRTSFRLDYLYTDVRVQLHLLLVSFSVLLKLIDIMSISFTRQNGYAYDYYICMPSPTPSGVSN